MLAIDEAIKVYFAEHDVFEQLRDRCMRKDFSWDKSAQTYIKMYSDICGNGYDPNVTFADAYDVLKVIYEDLKKERDEYLSKQPDDYSNIAEIRIEGPGEGTFHLQFSKQGMEMYPTSHDYAHVRIATSFDNLYNMATGVVSADKLFVNGQLKVDGNISKGAELRHLIGKAQKE